jgi:hypothetical protein
VSAKLTPEICINKASNNSRLTAAGRWDMASDSHSQNSLQTFFFLSNFDETATELHLCAEKLTEIVLHLNLGHIVGFFCCCSVLLCFVLFFLVFFSHLMRQQQNYLWDTISRIGGWRANTSIIKTETLLHLNLEIFSSFIYFFFFISNPFSVSLIPLQLTVD